MRIKYYSYLWCTCFLVIRHEKYILSSMFHPVDSNKKRKLRYSVMFILIKRQANRLFLATYYVISFIDCLANPIPYNYVENITFLEKCT